MTINDSEANDERDIIYPSLNSSGLKITNRYNQYGYLTRIRGEGGIALWQAEEMNARGQLVQMKLGNNVNLSREYNNITGILNKIKAGNNGQTTNIQNLEYTWDTLSNLDSRKAHNKNQGNGLLEEFTYDNLNRLTHVHLNGTETFNMDYDVLGNIDIKSDVGDYHHDEIGYAGPHAVTSIDANPGVISSQDQFIKYTSFDKVYNLTEGNATLDIVYGLNHERKRQVISDGYGNITTKTYVGGLYERIVKGGSVKEIYYLSGGDGLFGIYTRENGTDESLTYILKDHLGSVHCLIDEGGNLLEEQSFDAWGNRRDPETWQPYTQLPDFSFDRGYTGHEHLDLFSLINMNGRVYDPVICRFLSPDEFVQAPENLQNFNRYSYCYNNPLKYTDPSGEFIWMPIIIGAAIGGFSGWHIGEAAGATGWAMAGYIVGEAAIGGLSGFVGGSMVASGGFMANTMGLIGSSYTYSVGMASLSSTANINTNIGFSFGVGSYNISEDELGGIWNWSNNTTMENIGYTFGALANIQDIVAGFNGTTLNVKARPKLAGHSQVEGQYLTGYDANGNPIYEDILISVGPADHSIGQGHGVKWEMEYVKRTLQGNSVNGENVAYIRPNHPQLLTKLNNVNGKWLSTMTNRLNDGHNLLNTGSLKYGLFNGCVNYTSRALLYSGVINVNAFLPVTAPVLLNAELFIQQMGIYASPYLINY